MQERNESYFHPNNYQTVCLSRWCIVYFSYYAFACFDRESMVHSASNAKTKIPQRFEIRNGFAWTMPLHWKRSQSENRTTDQ